MRQAQSLSHPNTMPAPMPAGQIRALGMDSATWQKHASPWSVYTRMATLPFLAAAVWSHTFVGSWVSLALTAAVLVWLWINPRLFPAPARTDNWASKATFGERIWLNRGNIPIPGSDAKTAMVLSLVTGLGFITVLMGALTNDMMIMLPGILVTYSGKLVFLHRMVGLYEKMRNAHPLYRFWVVRPCNDNRRRSLFT